MKRNWWNLGWRRNRWRCRREWGLKKEQGTESSEGIRGKWRNRRRSNYQWGMRWAYQNQRGTRNLWGTGCRCERHQSSMSQLGKGWGSDREQGSSNLRGRRGIQKTQYWRCRWQCWGRGLRKTCRSSYRHLQRNHEGREWGCCTSWGSTSQQGRCCTGCYRQRWCRRPPQRECCCTADSWRDHHMNRNQIGTGREWKKEWCTRNQLGKWYSS